MKRRFIPIFAALVLLFQVGCGSSAGSTADSVSAAASGASAAYSSTATPAAVTPSQNLSEDTDSPASSAEPDGSTDESIEAESNSAAESSAEAHDPVTVYEIGVEETDIYQMYGDRIYEKDGVLCADVDILAKPAYTPADIDALQPGDTLEYCGELLTVTDVSAGENRVYILAGDEAIKLVKADTEPSVYTALDMSDAYITYSIDTRTLKLTDETKILTNAGYIWNDDGTSWEYGPFVESEELAPDALADYLTEYHSQYGQEAVIQLEQDTAVQIYLLFHP